jgi:hypothetical protein
VNLAITSFYLDGADTAEIIDTVHKRRPPMIFATPTSACRKRA